MNKRVFFAAVVFLLTLGAHAFAQEEILPQEKQGKTKSLWSFSFEQNMGARIGVYDEIVWANRSADNERYKQSELNYILTPAVYFGANFYADYKRLRLSFLSKFFLSQKPGILKDSDWRNDSFCGNGDISTKTDYSEHTLYITNKYAGFGGFDFEIKGDFKFHPTSFLTLAPVVSINTQYMTFSAANGKGQYGNYIRTLNWVTPSSDPLTRMDYSFDGIKVLEYELFNLLLWTGIKADFAPASWIKFELTSEVSPFYFFMDYDHHLTNNKRFKEYIFSAFYAFRQTIKTSITVGKNVCLCQTSSFAFSGETQGAMYLKQSTDSDYSRVANRGGSQFLFVDLDLSLKYSW